MISQQKIELISLKAKLDAELAKNKLIKRKFMEAGLGYHARKHSLEVKRLKERHKYEKDELVLQIFNLIQNTGGD